MPGYLVDEGGERTHAVLPMDEYESLKKAAKRLESVRGYAMEMISAMGEDGKVAEGEVSGGEAPGEGATGEGASGDATAAPEHGNSEADQQDRAWYQRT